MKKIALGLVLVMVAGLGFADITVPVNTEVKYQVASVKIPQVMVMRNRDGLMLQASYQWLDASNKVLRSGGHVVKQAQLATALGADTAGVVVGVLNKLVPTNGVQPMLSFNFLNDGQVSAVARTMVQVGTNRTMNVTRYATNEIGAALAPMTVDQLKGMVQQMTSGVLQN